MRQRPLILIATFIFLLTIAASLVRCAPETAVSPTPLPATATVTAAMPLIATAVPSTATPLPTTTTVPSTATATPQMVTATSAATATPPVETHLLTTEPVFVGGGVRLLDWSPDGRYLAYFTHTEEQMGLGGKGTFPPGTFTIYDTATAAICPVYEQTQVLGGGPESFLGPPHTWLPDSRLLILTDTGKLLLLEAPCGPSANITELFPEPISRVVSSSPDAQWLLIAGSATFWLYNLETGSVHPLAALQNAINMVWSPDGRHLAATLSGGSQILEAATGAIIATYAWEPAIDLGGTPSGPVWLSDNEMLIKISQDQGPFILTLTGEVRPILPLFNLEFEPGQTEVWANGFVDLETGHYHILLEGATQGGETRLPSQVYHSDTNSVEVLPTTPPDFSLEPWVYLDPDGTLSAPEGKRPITAVGAPFMSLPGDDCPDPYRTSFITNQFALSHHTPPGCDIETQWRLAYLAQYDFSANAFALLLPPPFNRWLAVALYDGPATMLFILHLENPT